MRIGKSESFKGLIKQSFLGGEVTNFDLEFEPQSFFEVLDQWAKTRKMGNMINFRKISDMPKFSTDFI